MTIAPLMISEKDDSLLGVANRSDAMGILAVWSTCARNLVPHLTEQTTNVRGFQILVEAFRLWEIYEPLHSEHAGRLEDFFLLIEQTFARIVGYHDHDWPLPGTRRVKARSSSGYLPHISLSDPEWHLLGGQKANGLWGLYRGASRRAELLDEDMDRLTAQTLAAASKYSGINIHPRLFSFVCKAMDGETVELPTNLNNQLASEIYNTFWNLPLASYLHKKLIEINILNSEIAQRLQNNNSLNHRTFFADAASNLPAHNLVINNAIRCENLLSIVEAVFLWLCASKGKSIQAATANMPVDLKALEKAHVAFGDSGNYAGATANIRHSRFCEQLDTTSLQSLAVSILALHAQVSEERHRSAWVWEEHGILQSDVEVNKPSKDELQVGVAWRNDYYLYPLKSIIEQLTEDQS